MGVVDYYELLGVERTADEQAIRAAIRKTRGRYRQQAGSPSLAQRSKAEQMIAQIADAEAAFETPESRRAYDAKLAAQARTPPPAQPSRETSRPARPQPGLEKDWVKAAQDYLDAGEARHALGASKEATRAEPGNPKAWQLRARASLETEDFHDASFAATEAMKLMPGDPAGPGLRGDVLRAEGRALDAEDAYRAAAELSPRTDSYWAAQVAFTLLDQDRPKDAVVEARATVVRFAGEQYAKDALARVLVADSQAAMSYDERGGRYIASRRQVEHVESRLAEIESLAPLSHSIHPLRDQLRANLASARSRRFLAPSGKLMLWVLAWVFIGSWLSWVMLSQALGDTLGLLLAVVVNVGLAAVLFLKVFPEQWRLNRQVLGDWAKTGLS